MNVVKTWHRPPGFARDFRGYALMDGNREISLHETATGAYAALERRERVVSAVRSSNEREYEDECGGCGAMLGPSSDFPWHGRDEDCRAVRPPAVGGDAEV